MDFVVVIPARYASTRLPGKPLLDIAGKPMIQHVYERACDSQASAVYVATDDQRIADAVREFGGECLMTRDDHQSGTDRIQEVAQQLGLPDDKIVVNVQGDEPLIPPATIRQVAMALEKNQEAGISSLYHSIHDENEWRNPNAVKVVVDAAGFALYFSRSPIPWQDGTWQSAAAQSATVDQGQTGGHFLARRHVGIYGYRVSTLNAFVSWVPSVLERSERLEQLRAMYHGVKIIMSEAEEALPAGVDTPEDLESIRRFLTDSEM